MEDVDIVAKNSLIWECSIEGLCCSRWKVVCWERKKVKRGGRLFWSRGFFVSASLQPSADKTPYIATSGFDYFLYDAAKTRCYWTNKWLRNFLQVFNVVNTFVCPSFMESRALWVWITSEYITIWFLHSLSINYFRHWDCRIVCLLNKFKHLVGAMLAWSKSQLLKPLLRVYRKVEQLKSRRPHKLRRRCLSCWLLTNFASAILPLSVAISMRYHRWTLKVVEQ